MEAAQSLLYSLRSLLLRALGKHFATDRLAKKYPVSVKGIITFDDECILLLNERDEWELPGGKIDPGESPETCLAREIREELGIEVRVGRPVHAWMYHILHQVRVFVVAYDCPLSLAQKPPIRISHEHRRCAWFTLADLEGINLPQGYRDALQKAMRP